MIFTGLRGVSDAWYSTDCEVGRGSRRHFTLLLPRAWADYVRVQSRWCLPGHRHFGQKGELHCFYTSLLISLHGMSWRRAYVFLIYLFIFYSFCQTNSLNTYCNPLTPLLRFVSDLLYKLYLHCYAAVGKNSRGPSAVAELLVTKRDVTQWQFPPPPVTKCHTLSDPSPSGRYVTFEWPHILLLLQKLFAWVTKRRL